MCSTELHCTLLYSDAQRGIEGFANANPLQLSASGGSAELSAGGGYGGLQRTRSPTSGSRSSLQEPVDAAKKVLSSAPLLRFTSARAARSLERRRRGEGENDVQ